MARITRFFLVLATVALAIDPDSVRAQSNSARDLLVKATKLTPELVLAITKVGQDKAVSVKAGTDIIKLVSQYCGTANARRYYLPLFLAANRDNQDIQSGKTILTDDADIKVPACLYANDSPAIVKASLSGMAWEQPIASTVSAIADAVAQINDSISTADATIKWVASVENTTKLQSTTKGQRLPNQSVNFDRLTKASASILPDKLSRQGPSLINQVNSDRLDDSSARITYDKVLKSALNVDPTILDKNMVRNSTNFERVLRTQDVLASNDTTDFTRLQTGAGVVSSDIAGGGFAVALRDGLDPKQVMAEVSATLKGDADSGVGIVSDYSPYFAVPLGDPDAKCQSSADGNWPINLDELKLVLTLRQKLPQKPTVGELMILDTGFPQGHAGSVPFRTNYFIKSSQNLAGRDPNLWTNSSKPEYYYDGYDNASHGVGVLALALGGPDVLDWGELPNFVAENQYGYVMSFMGYKLLPGNTLGVDDHVISSSLAGLNWGNAEIRGINLSLRFNLQTLDPQTDLSVYFTRRPDMFFVVAAGNDSQDVRGVYPAQWGGEQSLNVITVGGSEPDRTYWRKSNKSKKYVDIAAPACDVPTLVWNSGTKKFERQALSGTSFSAPLVSFAGNLLREYGLGARIKARILSSGRYSAALEDNVRSSRVLDVPTALATPFDAVRTADGKLRLGRINWPNGRTLCGSVQQKQQIAQISRADELYKNVSVVFRGNSQGEIDFQGCSLLGSQLTQIDFQPAMIADAGIQLGPVEALNFRTLESLTFCDKCFEGWSQ